MADRYQSRAKRGLLMRKNFIENNHHSGNLKFRRRTSKNSQPTNEIIPRLYSSACGCHWSTGSQMFQESPTHSLLPDCHDKNLNQLLGSNLLSLDCPELLAYIKENSDPAAIIFELATRSRKSCQTLMVLYSKLSLLDQEWMFGYLWQDFVHLACHNLGSKVLHLIIKTSDSFKEQALQTSLENFFYLLRFSAAAPILELLANGNKEFSNFIIRTFQNEISVLYSFPAAFKLFVSFMKNPSKAGLFDFLATTIEKYLFSLQIDPFLHVVVVYLENCSWPLALRIGHRLNQDKPIVNVLSNPALTACFTVLLKRADRTSWQNLLRFICNNKEAAVHASCFFQLVQGLADHSLFTDSHREKYYKADNSSEIRNFRTEFMSYYATLKRLI